jgi:hypothetical protein
MCGDEAMPGVIPPRRRWLAVGITGVALVMAIAFTAYVMSLVNTIEQQNKQLAAVLKDQDSLVRHLDALKEDLTRREDVLRVLSANRRCGI